ncbi:MAG: hypothetical protein OER95_12490 [Acidimicrobiia bacterium]|nr:hypothetical protein [Acidimicrobiia bacterium]
MTTLDHLLPGPEEAVRCADFARTIAMDPGGTAIRADRVVLVETGLPWPKPVFDHPTLREIDPLFKRAPRITRLLACRPPSESVEHPATGVWVFDRLNGHTRERRFEVGSPDQLLDLGACLVAEVAGDEITSVDIPAPTVDGVVDGPVVLVCTQGSHDVCCGADGERLAAAAESGDVPGVRVFRVSHTGGHRFAPTAMTLPDGRMWAYLVPELLDQLLSGQGAAAHLAQYCRGWWGADPGPAQVAERAVWAEVGFPLDAVSRTCVEVEPMTYRIETTPAGSAHSARDSWTVDVELVREVPTVACRKPGGLPAKVGREYRAAVRPQTL